MSRSFAAIATLSLAVGAWTTVTVCRYHYGVQTTGTNSSTASLTPTVDSNEIEVSSSAAKLAIRASASWTTLAELENDAAATASKIRSARDAISKAEDELTRAMADEAEIPGTIEQLTLDIERVEGELPDVRAQVVAAFKRLTEFDDTAGDRKKVNRERAAAFATKQFDDAVTAAKAARKKREDMRLQIGAIPSGQDEAILENSRIRAARENSEQTFVRSVVNADGVVDREGDSLRRLVHQATGQIEKLEREMVLAKDELEKKRARLESLPALQVSTRDRLAGLKMELAALSKLRNAQTLALGNATAELRRREEVARLETARAAQAREIKPEDVVAVSNAGGPIRELPNSNPQFVQTNPAFNRYYDPSYRPAVGDHYVRSSVRRDGTFVNGHMRTDRDDSFYNNWSSYGNSNPYTGSIGSKLPPMSRSMGGSTYVPGHFRSNGTYVNGYSRRSR